MSDLFRGDAGDITSGHPTTRNLAPAPDGPPPEPTGPLSASYPEAGDQPTDAVAYGPDIATEATFRLLGNLADKRVLQLGLRVGRRGRRHGPPGGAGSSRSTRRCTASRRPGPTSSRPRSRSSCTRATWPSCRSSGPTRSTSPSACYALANVDDLDRVFRQVHRVLHPECVFVFSLPHPAYAMLAADEADTDGVPVIRSYFDRSVRPWFTDTDQGEERIRTIGDLHTSLSRANFRVDTILEPEPAGGNHGPFWTDAMDWAPATLVIRARKEGI